MALWPYSDLEKFFNNDTLILGEIYLFLVGFHPKCALWGGGGDKMPCMRMAPGGWPLSNRWYLSA